MKGKNDSYDIKPDASGPDTTAVYKTGTSAENPHIQEESSLINDPNMPEVVVTGVSSPDQEDKESKEGPKVSACYEIRHGAEVAAKKVGKGCSDYWSSACSVDNLKQKLPIITWIPNYRLKTLKCDFIAGLTVGLTVIPQGMAYAALAGLELQV